MQLNVAHWTEQEYEALLQELQNIADEKYRQFQQKIVPGLNQLYGVRMPKLQEMAQEIANGNWQEFLSIAEGKHDVYEATLLEGLVIGKAGMPLPELLVKVRRFVSKIDNWAVNDSFCAALKQTALAKAEFLPMIQDYLHSRKEYEVRFGLIMLLDYYMSKEELPMLFSVCDAVNHTGYYVKMAVAWLLSICFVTDERATIQYLKKCQLDDWTYQKTLQKIRESKRVSAISKERLKKLKRTNALK